MSDSDTFRMTYSAEEKDEIEKIRSKYTDDRGDKMAKLRKLDRASELKAQAVGITVGVIGILVFGTGLSIALSELGNFFGPSYMTAGILVGLCGVIIMTAAYPSYSHTLRCERAKRKDEIVALADELMKEK